MPDGGDAIAAAVPEMFHILRLVDAYCDANLQRFVGTMFARLEVVPLRRLWCCCCRHQNHLCRSDNCIKNYAKL